MDEEMMEGQAPTEEAPVDPMDNLMAVLAELQERYGIDQAEMDAVVDAINAAFGGEVEEAPAEEAAPEEVPPEVPEEEPVA